MVAQIEAESRSGVQFSCYVSLHSVCAQNWENGRRTSGVLKLATKELFKVGLRVVYMNQRL